VFWGFRHDVLSESLVGDDRRAMPIPRKSYNTPEDVVSDMVARDEWESYHFPYAADSTVDGVERYLSRGYLAVVTLGTTGWSGWRESEGQAWVCTVADLTEAGRSLYDQMAHLYPGCDLHLLTFLDT